MIFMSEESMTIHCKNTITNLLISLVAFIIIYCLLYKKVVTRRTMIIILFVFFILAISFKVFVTNKLSLLNY